MPYYDRSESAFLVTFGTLWELNLHLVNPSQHGR